MSAMNQFDWVDFYKELSGKLLAYKGNRQELISKIKQIFSNRYSQAQVSICQGLKRTMRLLILIHAKTDEDIYPENEYRMSGNRIEVRTLNLDGDFEMIKAQLDGIAEKYFQVRAS